MAKYRVRFNDKARAGAVARRNELKRKRQKQFHRDEEEGEPGDMPETTADPNAQVLLPLTDEQKDQRKRQLHEDLVTDKKMSSLKKKRLDKYIDRQVRRQERDEIFAKLAASTVNTSNFQSLKRLGQKGDLEKEFASESEREDQDQSESDSESDTQPKSTFVDFRPSAGGFGFQNLPQIKKAAPQKQKKVSWREKLGMSADTDDEHSENETDSESESDSGSDSSDCKEAKLSDDESESEKSGNDEANQEEESESEEAEANEENEQNSKSIGAQFSNWAHSLEKHESLPTPIVEGYKHTPRVEPQEPVQDFSKGGQTRGKTFFVNVERPEEIDQLRLNLPALACEQQIMDAIHHHDCVVLTGETGSGKTTQVPQFLYEAGYGSNDSETPGMIAITQPRRVAAVSMAERVSVELGNHGHRVGYQIRFDSQTGPDTKVKFMTDGVLLREMSSDLMLTKYSAVIVDEAHERSVNTDILIGLLSRIVKLRREEGKPLKLIIMSATLRVSDFTENTTLFPTPPPIVSVEARQFPVAMHFSRRTTHDYVNEAISKAIKIHEKLPKGGILIFLTGQNEISFAVNQLRKYSKEPTLKPAQVRLSAKETVMEEETVDFDLPEDETDYDDDNSDEESEEEGFEEEYDGEETKLHVLPLYSLLPTQEQMKVFEKVPKGTRLCVVATNVAETSLTIPNVRYVVDSGRAKQRVCDQETGVQKFKVGWVSKASADQRAGRAGRTGPGHCYRLYSSAVYERDFSQFSAPEISRMPIEGLVLQMKAMGIHHIVNFPFPSPPPRESLAKGIELLQYLGALDKEMQLTDLGKQMSLFPLNPRHAKMLLIGNQHGCMGYVIAVVAALSVGDPFIPLYELLPPPVKPVVKSDDSEDEEEEEEFTVEEKERQDKLRQRFNQVNGMFSGLDKKSDVIKALAAVAGYDFANSTSEYCKENFLRSKIMTEITKLRQQLAYLVASTTRPDAIESTTQALSKQLQPPTKVQLAALKQIVTAGYIDLIAVRADSIDDSASVGKKTSIINHPYITLMPGPEKYAYIHPGSVLSHLGSQPPEFLVYHALTMGDAENAKVRLRTLADTTASAISHIAAQTPLVTYSKPLGGAHAPKVLSPTKRIAWVVPRMGAAIGSGGVGWDLPARKVTQVKRGGEWCTVD